MNFLQVAREYASQVHAGQHFKYVEGPYIQHPIAVSERLHTVHEKALAFMHDAPERQVEVWLGRKYTLEQEEEAIARALLEMQRFFGWYGLAVERSFIDDLNILTKRKMDGRPYSGYTGGIRAHARKTSSLAVVKVKKADLIDNSLESRNPPLAYQTEKDMARLRRYAEEYIRINKEFPEAQYPFVRLRPIERINVEQVRPHRPRDPRRGNAVRLGWAETDGPEYR